MTVKGDFNKDGVDDMLVVAKDEASVKAFDFYFGSKNGEKTLFRSYKMSLEGSVQITVKDNGVIRIQNDIGDGSDIFLFRFQKGDFILIGGKKDRHKTEHYDDSYNFSTGFGQKERGQNRQAKQRRCPSCPRCASGGSRWHSMNWATFSRREAWMPIPGLQWESTDGCSQKN